MSQPLVQLPDMEYTIAYDLATRTTGWFAALDDKLVGGGVIKAGDWLDMSAKVEAHMAEHKPSTVCIEDVYLGKNAETHKMLAMLLGAVVRDCVRHGRRCYMGNTSQIDSRCGIPQRLRRTARKQATRAFARQVGWEVPQDVADALCVLWWGMGERTRDRMVNGEEWK